MQKVIERDMSPVADLLRAFAADFNKAAGLPDDEAEARVLELSEDIGRELLNHGLAITKADASQTTSPARDMMARWSWDCFAWKLCKEQKNCRAAQLWRRRREGDPKDRATVYAWACLELVARPLIRWPILALSQDDAGDSPLPPTDARVLAALRHLERRGQRTRAEDIANATGDQRKPLTKSAVENHLKGRLSDDELVDRKDDPDHRQA